MSASSRSSILAGVLLELISVLCLVLYGYGVRFRCDRATQMCTLQRFPIKAVDFQSLELPEIRKAWMSRSADNGDGHGHRVELETTRGVVPLTKSFSGVGMSGKRKTAERINMFLENANVPRLDIVYREPAYLVFGILLAVCGSYWLKQAVPTQEEKQ
jgi:hypothetical protein